MHICDARRSSKAPLVLPKNCTRDFEQRENWCCVRTCDTNQPLPIHTWPLLYLGFSSDGGEQSRGGDETSPSPSDGVPPGDVSLSGPTERTEEEKPLWSRGSGVSVNSDPGVGWLFALVEGDGAPLSPFSRKDASHLCISEISWPKSRTLWGRRRRGCKEKSMKGAHGREVMAVSSRRLVLHIGYSLLTN